jgi:hypothetical protein
MRRVHLLPVVGAAGVVVSLALGACSSGSNATALLTVPMDGGDGTGVTKVSEAGETPDGATSTPFDASADQPAIDTLCQQAKLLGKPTEEIASTFSVYPAVGGTLVAGTYELEGVESYGGGLEASDAGNAPGDDDGGDDDDSGGPVVPNEDGGEPPPTETAAPAYEQKTLVLEADGLFSLASATGTVDAGVGATTITAGVYVASGSTLVLHATCPATSTATYTFTASGGELLLFDSTTPTTVETFQQVAVP